MTMAYGIALAAASEIQIVRRDAVAEGIVPVRPGKSYHDDLWMVDRHCNSTVETSRHGHRRTYD